MTSLEVDGAGTSSARRRRERRPRSWLRHDRMTVAMELTAATHHSSPKGGWPETTHNAPRGQRAASSAGAHTGVLKESEVQLEAATVGYVAAGAPLLPVSSLHGADGVDDTAVRTLLELALHKKKEEEEKRKLEVEERMAQTVAGMPELACLEEWLTKRRRKKKRRKRRLPRTSSHSTCGRARRRQRQWHARNAGFPCDVTPCAVFPSVVDRPEMLGVMAGMDQKHINAVGWFCW